MGKQKRGVKVVNAVNIVVTGVPSNQSNIASLTKLVNGRAWNIDAGIKWHGEQLEIKHFYLESREWQG